MALYGESYCAVKFTFSLQLVSKRMLVSYSEYTLPKTGSLGLFDAILAILRCIAFKTFDPWFPAPVNDLFPDLISTF